MARAIGVTQGNVSHYEKGQTVPPGVAKRVIVFAASQGCRISYEDIYGPPCVRSSDAAMEPAHA